MSYTMGVPFWGPSIHGSRDPPQGRDRPYVRRRVFGAIAYVLFTFKCLISWEQHPRNVFVDGQRLSLSAVEDDLIRSILKKVLVLDPTQRPTARELGRLLQAPITSPNERGTGTVLNEGHKSLGCTLHSTNPAVDQPENRLTSITEAIIVSILHPRLLHPPVASGGVLLGPSSAGAVRKSRE